MIADVVVPVSNRCMKGLILQVQWEPEVWGGGASCGGFLGRGAYWDIIATRSDPTILRGTLGPARARLSLTHSRLSPLPPVAPSLSPPRTHRLLSTTKHLA